MTDEWERVDIATLRRRFAEDLAKLRTEAHRQVDAIYDEDAAKQELQFELMARDLLGTPPH